MSETTKQIDWTAKLVTRDGQSARVLDCKLSHCDGRTVAVAVTHPCGDEELYRVRPDGRFSTTYEACGDILNAPAEPIIKPWTAETVPLRLAKIRRRDWPPGCWDAVTAVCSTHIVHGAKSSDRVTWDELARDWLWEKARSGGNWQPCGDVEVQHV